MIAILELDKFGKLLIWRTTKFGGFFNRYSDQKPTDWSIQQKWENATKVQEKMFKK